ncbi:phosphatidylethanolamine-binding protein [Aspergillus karnatakaensis]|uniref:YbhB/YbcL family Raf kinase inhibitor-like protein n=1 Tax=Aspergillus karnatakaensis TaxID=1810916 RepID=UPI003CCCD5B2
MPDVSRYETIIKDLESGTYPTLALRIGTQDITPGAKIAKNDTTQTPTLSAPADLLEGTYAVISLDIDAPFRSWNVLSPIVHWIQTDLTSNSKDLGLESSGVPVVPWLPAGPPPGAAPHRYLFLLYRQGELMEKQEGASLTRLQRMRFDVDGMVGRLGLGEIVAVNYFVAN